MLWWQLLGMGSWCPPGERWLPRLVPLAGTARVPERALGCPPPPGTSTAAGFIAPWEPRFVKGRSGSPDTGTGEDGFPFSAVRLPTPLILRVQMMNFFLFFFFLLFIFPPASPPTALPQQRKSRTDGALQGSRSAHEDTEPAHSTATWPQVLGEALISSGRGSGNDFSIPGGWVDGWMERS